MNTHPPLSFKRHRLAAALASILAAPAYAAVDCTVSVATDDGTGTTANTLSWAIKTANTDVVAASGHPGGGCTNNTITLTTNVTVTGVMKRLIDSDLTLTSDSTTRTISGGSTYRPLFIKSGTITIKNLNLSNGKAQGGSSEYGGAGAGLGGALFIYDGTVTVQDVTFANNTAQGGSTSIVTNSSLGNGGAGLFGGSIIPATTTTVAGIAMGGGGLFARSTGTAGGYGGTGNYGGSKSTTGSGHFGGGAAGFSDVNGSAGGFGGGGSFGNTTGGTGGFGGGGGSGSGRAGGGGFGGGGGGGSGYISTGKGGYGGGDGVSSKNSSLGGGGAGFGGAIFVKKGTLSLKRVVFNTNSAVRGSGTRTGLGKGGSIFICTNDLDGDSTAKGATGGCSGTINEANSYGVSFTSGTASDSQADLFWRGASGGTHSTAGITENLSVTITGNNIEISHGDITPSATDNTDWGTNNVSSKSSHTFTINNVGTSALTLKGSPRVALTASTGQDCTPFTVTAQPASSVAATTGSTTFAVQYAPTSAVTSKCTVSIPTDNASYNPYTFVISGTAQKQTVSGMTLGSSTNPAVYSDRASFAVTFPSGPTGTVSFQDNGTVISGCSSQAISPFGFAPGGMADCSTSGLSIGTHTITAVYSGDTTYLTATTTLSGGFTVATCTGRPLTLESSSFSPSTYGDSLGFTLYLGAIPTVSTGTVTFQDNGTPIIGCTSQEIDNGGTASCTTSALSGGTHTLTAVYSGDSACPSSSAATLAGGFTVNPASQTIGAISFSSTSLTAGGTITASATASSGLAVTFASKTTSICTVSGSTVTGVSAGTCTITADQSGNSNYSAATQVTKNITVSGASGTNCAVTQSSDDGTGDTANTLSWAIKTANSTWTGSGHSGGGCSNNTITLNTDVTLTGLMTALIDSNLTLTNDGTIRTISGGSVYRPLFVKSGTVTIKNLNVTNGKAKGGNSKYGGTGAGFGGALFVYGGTVTVQNVTFSNNSAQGGTNTGTRNGGGGMSGNGGATAGGGLFAAGDSGGYGGIGNYGGGNSAFGGGGLTSGAAGGFGGGGATGGGTGGFGGGGGKSGGAGGFGAGGGTSGTGGYGSGSSSSTVGGNSAGFGGAIFVKKGVLILQTVTFNNNSAAQGTGSNYTASGKGGAIFICTSDLDTDNSAKGAKGGCDGSILESNSYSVSFGTGTSVNVAAQGQVDLFWKGASSGAHSTAGITDSAPVMTSSADLSVTAAVGTASTTTTSMMTLMAMDPPPGPTPDPQPNPDPNPQPNPDPNPQPNPDPNPQPNPNPNPNPQPNPDPQPGFCTPPGTPANASNPPPCPPPPRLPIGSLVPINQIVTNLGPDPATGVKLHSTLPVGAPGIPKVTTSQGTCGGSTEILCDLGDLAVNATATVQIWVQTQHAGQWPATVTVRSDTGDPVVLNNSATVNLTIGSSAETYIDFLYTQLLGRSRGTDESGWIDLFDSGQVTAAQLVAHFLASSEYRQRMLIVQRLYYVAFKRDPDLTGLHYWVALPLDALPEQFLTSTEFENLWGATLTDTDFVTLLYHNALGRDPDPNGLAYWVSVLDGGQLSRAQLLSTFVNSDEQRSTIDQRLEMVLLYQSLLGRDPTAAELATAKTQDIATLTQALLTSQDYSGPAVP